MRITASLAILLFVFPLLCGTARAQQPWEWRTPSLSSVFSTKEDAAAAMRARIITNSILTVESGPEIRGSEQIFTYTGPDVPAVISPWCYYTGFGDCYESEEKAKSQMLQRIFEIKGSTHCPLPYIVREGDWVTWDYFRPPLPHLPNWEAKGVAVATFERTAYYLQDCKLVNGNGLLNFTVYRRRTFDCTAEYPFKNLYINNYDSATGQGDIWSCRYNAKDYVKGNPLLTGCTEGNPCNVRNGDKSETETDYRGPALSFVRYLSGPG